MPIYVWFSSPQKWGFASWGRLPHAGSQFGSCRCVPKAVVLLWHCLSLDGSVKKSGLDLLWKETSSILSILQLFKNSSFLKNWSIIDLQCCVSFRCTAQQFSYTHIYTYTYMYLFFRFFSLIGCYKILSIVPCAI